MGEAAHKHGTRLALGDCTRNPVFTSGGPPSANRSSDSGGAALHLRPLYQSGSGDLLRLYLADLGECIHKILECIEQETSNLKGEECELVISNVRNDADPLLEQVLAQLYTYLGKLLDIGQSKGGVRMLLVPQRDKFYEMEDQWSGLLGSSLAVIKTSARYSLSALKDFPLPFWLSVVLERTGFTQGDLRAAQRLPVPSKVLSSDTKDLAYAVRRAYSAVPAIYVITVAIRKTSPPPTLESVIKGGPSVVHVYIKRHATKKWLQTDDAVEKLCREILAAKDASLDEHITEHRFGDKGLQAIGRPPKCFLVVISSILLWALKLNFVCRSTLLVSSAAFFTGRMLALFGRGVLLMLRCLMGAVIANITWSDHLKPICEVLIVEFFETLDILPYDVDWW
ncbi:PREDICTED: 1-acyl-sn-glycerol-3-phosphate acyltransferase 2-like [Fragaria vesca subsp. vesca]